MDHVNFVQLGFPRSGSNLLLRALAEHPQIRMIGEVLHNDPATRAEAWRRVNPNSWPQPRGEGYQSDEDGGEFLARRIYSDGPIDMLRAFGFKLYYDDAHFDEHGETAWDYLLSHNSIKVIHLTRQNLLEALVSREVAQRTNRWYQIVEDPSPAPPAPPPFALDPFDCQRYFDHITAKQAWAKQAFAKHDVLEVEYERDLCDNFNDTTRRIHKFLQMVPWYMRPGMVRLRTIPTAAQLANFQELHEFFRQSPYSEFFEESHPRAEVTREYSISSNPSDDATHSNFVVLGHARCGSNLLIRALTEHPQIRVIGEVLSRDEETRRTAWQRVSTSAWRDHSGDGYQTGEDGAQFLQQKIFRSSSLENLRTFGFKLFYTDARFDDKVVTAWDYLTSNDVRIIHIIRRNLLLALISQEVANRTQRWFQLIEEKDQAKSPLPPFELSPAYCREYFDRITECREQARTMFTRNPTITVEYEAGLCNDFRGTTLEIFDFLGVMPWIVRPGLAKQQGVPASQQISNFSELREHFKDSPYAAFFETADELAEARA